jgi:hypothetical protein
MKSPLEFTNFLVLINHFLDCEKSQVSAALVGLIVRVHGLLSQKFSFINDWEDMKYGVSSMSTLWEFFLKKNQNSKSSKI